MPLSEAACGAAATSRLDLKIIGCGPSRRLPIRGRSAPARRWRMLHRLLPLRPAQPPPARSQMRRWLSNLESGEGGRYRSRRGGSIRTVAQELADNDPGIDRVISADGAVRLFSIGEAMTLIVFVSGACRDGPNSRQFWLMLVDNGFDQARAPDIVAFLVSDRGGKRLAYGTGPIHQGDISIKAKQ